MALQCPVDILVFEAEFLALPSAKPDHRKNLMAGKYRTPLQCSCQILGAEKA